MTKKEARARREAWTRAVDEGRVVNYGGATMKEFKTVAEAQAAVVDADCAQWPLNVRPEGYYGEAPRAQKAVAKAAGSPRKSGPPRAKPQPKRADPVDAVLSLLAGMSPEQRAEVRAYLDLAG